MEMYRHVVKWCVVLVFLFFFTGAVSANPIPVPMLDGVYNIDVMTKMAVIALFLEFVCIAFGFCNELRLWKIVLLFLVVNLITYPITLFSVKYIYLFAEIIPLTLEPVLYSLLLIRCDFDGRRMVSTVILANFVSFYCGLFLYHAMFSWARLNHGVLM